MYGLALGQAFSFFLVGAWQKDNGDAMGESVSPEFCALGPGRGMSECT